MEKKKLPKLVVDENGALRIESHVILYNSDITGIDRFSFYCDGPVDKDYPAVVISGEVLKKFAEVNIVGGVVVCQDEEQVMDFLAKGGII